MHRVDTDGNQGGLFTDGNPATGTLGTKLDDDWANAVQEEICGVIEGTGGTLVKGTNSQLLGSCVATATANKIVRRDASGRAQVADPSAAADIATKAYVDGRGWHRVVASADTSTTSANGVDITGLSFAAASGKKYLVRARLFCYAGATTSGIGFSAKSTSAPSASAQFFEVTHWSNTPSFDHQRIAVFSDTPAACSTTTESTSSSQPQVDGFEGYLVTTGTGTFQLRLGGEVGEGTITVKAGSYLEWCEVP